MQLSASQIAQYAAAAGFTGGDLPTAVAVAIAESSGKTDAYNPEGSYGLWQIYRPDHPEFASWDLTDPALNARAAFIVYSNAGGSFTPWTTFKTRAYERYLPGSQVAVASLTAPSQQGVEIGPGVTVLPPAPDPGANIVTADSGAAQAQIPAVFWIIGGAVVLWSWLSD